MKKIYISIFKLSPEKFLLKWDEDINDDDFTGVKKHTVDANSIELLANEALDLRKRILSDYPDAVLFILEPIIIDSPNDEAKVFFSQEDIEHIKSKLSV